MSIAHVFRVDLPVVSRAHCPRFARFTKQLIWLLVHAYDRPCRVVRPFVDIEHVFHVRYKVGICPRRKAPVVGAVRSQLVFFNVLRMASRLTGVSSSIFMRSSSSRMVHREWPSGAGSQAVAIIMASALPSTFRRAWSEFTLRFKAMTASIPPSLNFLTMFATVLIQIPCALAHSACLRTGGRASSKSSNILHLLANVSQVDFFRSRDLS